MPSDNPVANAPLRSGIDAVKAVHRLLCQGFTDVVDADLSKYLDVVSYCPQGYQLCYPRLGV